MWACILFTVVAFSQVAESFEVMAGHDRGRRNGNRCLLGKVLAGNILTCGS